MIAGMALAAVLLNAPAEAALADCHVAGIAQGVQCGVVRRPLDPADAGRGSIDVGYVVVPALARRKLADPVFMLAGGPGQSATALASTVLPVVARLNTRRDIVFVDQRGTGRSAPLVCADPNPGELAEQADPERQFKQLMRCKAELLKLPYIHAERDLGLFTTAIAVQDLDAVRRALGAEQVDLVGGSYGTRVGLEYLRQFPTRVRRAVLDGVAPPDMVLPASFSVDNQAAFDALLAACRAEPACAAAHPKLHLHWESLLASLPRPVVARHPLTGREERFTLTREMVLSAVRGALYAPWLAAALPVAIERADEGEPEGLLGLAATFTSRKSTQLAIGMHFSVVCAEDLPRLADATERPAADFGNDFAATYERMCAGWPRGAVPEAFYRVGPSMAPVLLLSGGADPATPPRHGERVARLLGARARHVVVPNAGHGTMALGCLRDVVYKFIDAADTDTALAVDASCVAGIPRPPAFRPIAPGADSPPEPMR
ncbi:MAG: alpha/beta fold hydrolase [Caldimonas sp.]